MAEEKEKIAETVTEEPAETKAEEKTDAQAEEPVFAKADEEKDTVVFAPVDTPSRKPVENEYRVYNNKACAYIMQGVDPEHEEGFAVNCYLENRSAGTLNFTWSDVTINGKPVATDYEEAVLPGTLG